MHTAAGSAHCVPGSHVPPQPSLGALPHGRDDAGVQLGVQHVPPLQTCPLGHMVPSPHSRQTLPSARSTGAIGAPQATVSAAGQLGQHSRSSGAPGGVAHDVPAGHISPTPGHERQAGSGMGSPHAIVAGAGQSSQHTPLGPPVQLEPAGHPVP